VHVSRHDAPLAQAEDETVTETKTPQISTSVFQKGTESNPPFFFKKLKIRCVDSFVSPLSASRAFLSDDFPGISMDFSLKMRRPPRFVM
jgi:hypothetical protein